MIDYATLSLCFGATFGVSSFAGIDSASGLRRRFGYYVATTPARLIDWPGSLDGSEMDHLAGLFAKLASLKGVIQGHTLPPATRKLWTEVQRRNRQLSAEIFGITSSDETRGASLNESPARILKLAAIFEVCRWAAGSTSDPLAISADVLAMAEQHQLACLDAMEELDSLIKTAGRREVIEDECEVLLAKLAANHPGPGEILRTKSQLTREFAANPGRAGALTASRLYGEIMPALIRSGRARIYSSEGKKVTYAIKTE